MTPPQYLSLRYLLPDLAEHYSVEFGMLFLEHPFQASHLNSYPPNEVQVHALRHLATILPLEEQFAHLLLLAELALDRWEVSPFPVLNSHAERSAQQIGMLRSKRAEALAHLPTPNLAYNFFALLHQTSEFYWRRLAYPGNEPVRQASWCLSDIGNTVETYLHENNDPAYGMTRLCAHDCQVCLVPTKAESNLLTQDILLRVRRLIEQNL